METSCLALFCLEQARTQLLFCERQWNRALLKVLRQAKADPGYHQLFIPLPYLDYFRAHLGFS